MKQTSLITRPTDTQMNVNITYDEMMLPVQGPENPFGDRNRFVNQNALAGHVEEQSMSEHAFRQQHLTHSILGYSANPSIDPNAPAVLGSLEAAQANGFATVDALRTRRVSKKDLKRKRKARGDLDVVEGEGAYVGPWGNWEGDEPESIVTPDMMEEDPEEESEEEEVIKKRVKPKRGAPGQEHSVFHGKSMKDYQGRTYMYPPVVEAPQLQSEPGSQESFIPKVCVHTWTGHTQGVSVIRLLPDTGHLMLSGSMDTKIKVCFFVDSIFSKKLTFDSAMGRVHTRKLCADFPRSHKSGQGRYILERRQTILVLCSRPSNETMGHGDWPMHPALQQRQDAIRCALPP